MRNPSVDSIALQCSDGWVAAMRSTHPTAFSSLANEFVDGLPLRG